MARISGPVKARSMHCSKSLRVGGLISWNLQAISIAALPTNYRYFSAGRILFDRNLSIRFTVMKSVSGSNLMNVCK